MGTVVGGDKLVEFKETKKTRVTCQRAELDAGPEQQLISEKISYCKQRRSR